MGQSDEPLFLAFKTIFGDGVGTRVLALIAVAGLIASFHGIIYAYGRNIYSLSRAGYFPRWLSITHSERKTPHVALIVGAIIGYCVALLLHFLPKDSSVGAVLLNMAVFGAVISYIMQCAAFIILRRRHPSLERPFKSPLGTFGSLGCGHHLIDHSGRLIHQRGLSSRCHRCRRLVLGRHSLVCFVRKKANGLGP